MRLAIACGVLAAACSHHGPTTTGAGSGEGSGSATAPLPIEVTVTDGDSAKAQAGKQVALKGTARDAKLSAVVVADGNFIVYCLGVDSWPSAISGKPVVAHGTLEQSDEFTAKPGPNGEVSAGTGGPVWVLRNCKYDQ